MRADPVWVFGLGLVLVSLVFSTRSDAACNLIPTSTREFRTTSGFVAQTLAIPGSFVTVRADLACQPEIGAFQIDGSGIEVEITFEPPQGSLTKLLLSSGTPPSPCPFALCNTATLQLDNCGLDRCDTLSFVLPDTDALLEPDGDRQGLTGAIRVEVRSMGTTVVDAGPLFQPTDSCDPADRVPEEVFGRLSALPPTNIFVELESGAQPELLATVDGNGNLLVPLDYGGVLPESPEAADFRVLSGTANLDAFLAAPGIAIQPPDSSYLRAFTLEGRPIPPVLAATDDGTLLGTVDAPTSVVRIAARDPSAPAPTTTPCGQTDPECLFNVTDRLESGIGPIVISSGLQAETQSVAPLANLASTPDLVVFARNEALENTDLNGDGDVFDQVIEVLDRSTGNASPSGATPEATVEQVLRNGRARAAVTAGGDLVAFLESEARQQADVNGDGDPFDTLLRVFTADGIDLTQFDREGNPIDRPRFDVDPAFEVNGGPFAVDGGYVFFRRREGDGAPLVVENLTTTILGAAPTQSWNIEEMSSDGRFVLIRTVEPGVVPGQASVGPVPSELLLFDRESQQVVAFPSLGSDGFATGESSFFGRMSEDATIVTFYTRAPEVCGGMGDAALCILDRSDGSRTLIADADSSPLARARPSRDGRFVVFSTNQIDLPGKDGDGTYQVFLLDRNDGSVEHISVGVDGSPSSTGFAFAVNVSNDGRFVLFSTDASDLLPLGEDTNGGLDPYVLDRHTGVFRRLTAGVEGGSATTGFYLSTSLASGRVLADDAPGSPTALFMATPGGIGTQQVYAADVETGEVELLSIGADGQPADAFAEVSAITPDGRYALMTSLASNLGPGVPVDDRGLFFLDRVTGTFRFVSSLFALQDFFVGHLSADARIVAGDLDFDISEGSFDHTEAIVIDTAPSASLNSDADDLDFVLQVFDSDTSEVTLSAGSVAAEAISVAGGRAGFLVPEASEGGVTLNPLADNDAEDRVVHVYEPPAASPLSLGYAAVEVSMSSSLLCFTISEEDHGATDLNGSGSADEAILATWSSAAEPATRTQEAAEQIQAVGGRCVYRSPADGALKILNGTSGMVVSIDDGFGTPVTASEYVAGEDPSGDLVAFRTRESTRDLNDDGDLDDFVMQVVDLADNSLTPTGYAARICDLPACEPFFEPYRIAGRVVSFLTHESEQSGPATGRQADGSIGGTGCLPTSLPGECDLNGDGDADDLVVQVFSLESQATQAYAIDEDSPPLDASPFPGSSALLADGGPTILSLEVDEAAGGVDLDGDGEMGVVVLIVGDSDGDGTLNDSETRDDNCIELANADQADDDSDRLGNVCDAGIAQLPELPCDAVPPMGVVDSLDVQQVFADRGMSVTGPDARDPDGDGVVTVLDAGRCVTCWLDPNDPSCAPSPVEALPEPRALQLLSPGLLLLLVLYRARFRRTRGTSRY